MKYFYPFTTLWGGGLSYICFINFDFGSDLADKSGGVHNNNAIDSSHILALAYDHLHYSLVARYFHHGGQWRDGSQLDFGNGPFSVASTGWGYYLVVGYNF